MLVPASIEFDPFSNNEAPVLTGNYPEAELPDRARLGRTYDEQTFYHQGEVIRVRIYDKVSSEDWVTQSARATAYSLKRGEPYRGTPPAREIRDALLKTDVVI